MLKRVKLALRITTNAFDQEIEDLIAAALADLALAGVVYTDAGDLDPLVLRAVILYCKAYFGVPQEYEAFKAAYDENKAQMSMATGYTDWGE